LPSSSASSQSALLQSRCRYRNSPRAEIAFFTGDELVEEELAAALGRGRYERGGKSGHRHGHRCGR
jgi:hypothetical protein